MGCMRCCLFVRQGKTRSSQVGMTLIELLLAIAVAAILSTMAIASYAGYMERARVAQAKADILAMSVRIEQFYTEWMRYPDALTDVGSMSNDPWERPYVYVDLTTATGNGMARRDRSLNPLNSDFDLYSIGKDGLTKKPITQRDSLDDVLRANDGRFIDLASKF